MDNLIQIDKEISKRYNEIHKLKTQLVKETGRQFALSDKDVDRLFRMYHWKLSAVINTIHSAQTKAVNPLDIVDNNRQLFQVTEGDNGKWILKEKINGVWVDKGEEFDSNLEAKEEGKRRANKRREEGGGKILKK